MKIAVRYYSKTGNSRKLADAIAAELGVTAKPVSVPLDEPVDKLVLCNSLYYAKVDKRVEQFVKDNAAKMHELVNVSNGAVFQSSYEQMKGFGEKYGVPVSTKEFHCLGQSEVSHIGHPNAQDLKNAVSFIRTIAA